MLFEELVEMVYKNELTEDDAEVIALELLWDPANEN
jgi:hypothetical protein